MLRQIKINPTITRRSCDSLNKYLAEISHESILTPEDEVFLAQAIHNGNEKALNKLICSNLKFVVSNAKQYENQGLQLEDLINEGNIGLVEAAKRFDETRGFKFISYSV